MTYKLQQETHAESTPCTQETAGRPTDAPAVQQPSSSTRVGRPTDAPTPQDTTAGQQKHSFSPRLTATVEEITDEQADKLRTRLSKQTTRSEESSLDLESEEESEFGSSTSISGRHSRRKSTTTRRKPGSRKSSRGPRSRSPSRRRAKAKAATERQPTAQVFTVETPEKLVVNMHPPEHRPSPLKTLARVQDHEETHSTLVDTGADTSLLQLQYLREEIPGYSIDDPRIVTLKTANGLVDTLGSVIIPIAFGDGKDGQPEHVYRIKFHVVHDVPPGFLIGTDVIVALKMSLFPHLNEIEIKGRRYPATASKPTLPDPINVDHSREVRLRESFTVRTGPVNVPAHLISPDPQESRPMLVEPTTIGNGNRPIRGPRALVPGGEHNIQYQLFNASNKPIRLPRGTLLGIAHPVEKEQVTSMGDVDNLITKLEQEAERMEEESVQCAIAEYMGGGHPNLLCDEDSEEFENEYKTLLDKIHINDKLTDHQRERVEALLRTKLDAFASARNPMGCTDMVHFDVDTGDAKPIHLPPYRASPARREIIRANVEELKRAKIIQQSNSEWSSPVILVEQRGRHRMCVDLRGVNKVTLGDSYPVPRIADILESLEGAKWFSSFDLNRGYHQVKNTPRARKRLAFRTQDGLWEPLRMPFGAKGAPATFQRLMDALLAEGRWLWVMAYIDDVVVFSKTFDDHIRHVDWVLDRMITAGLTLGPEKSHVAMNSIELLGHNVSNIGIMLGEKAMEAIREQRMPRTVKEMSRFLGLTSHYRQFVRNFARESAPLRDVKREAIKIKQSTIDWSPEATYAYHRLIELMLQRVVLAHPDYSKPFIIEVDSSQDGIGAVLSQRDDKGHCRPIAFVSRQTIDGEKNMSATDLECTGIMWALDKLRPYVEGSKIELRCDHQALKGLANYKGQNKRMIRASAHLMSYLSDIDFTYVPGEKMEHVDQLSRNPQPLTPEQVERLRESCEVYLLSNDGADTEKNKDDTKESLMCWRIDPDPTFMNEIAKKLLHDEDYTKLLDEILQRYDLPDTKPYDRSLWPQIMHHPKKPFIVNDGLLFTSSQARNTHTLVVPNDAELRHEILRRYHDSPTAAHRGADRTYASIADSYWWKGLSRDTRKYVTTCDVCQRTKPDNALPPGLLKSLPLTKRRWSIIQVDWMVDLPPSGNEKFTAVMVVIDRMTKRIVLTPTWSKDMRAEDVARSMFENVFRYFGLPNIIVSDRDSRLTSDLWRSLMNYLGVQHRFATTAHQQTDGATERVIRWLKEAMRAYIDKDATNWSSFLSRLEIAHNASVQSSTGMTPFEMDMGRVPFFLHGPQQPDLAGDPQATSLRQKMELDAIMALDLLDSAQRKQQKQYDSRHREIAYQPGDEVLIRSDVYQPIDGVKRRKRGAEQKGRKLGPTFWGPFRITSIPFENVAQLALAPGMKAHNRISFAYLRKYHPRQRDPTAVREFECVVDARPRHNGEIQWRIKFKQPADGSHVWDDEWVDETALRFFGGGAVVDQHREEAERLSGANRAYTIYSFNADDGKLANTKATVISALRDAADRTRGSVADQPHDPESRGQPPRGDDSPSQSRDLKSRGGDPPLGWLGDR